MNDSIKHISHLFLFSILFLLISCDKKDVIVNEKWQNKFADETLREIYNLKDQRNTVELLPFLAHNDQVYRKESALAFGSVQDSVALASLTQLMLKDSVQAVRAAAAFAIGQTGNSVSLEYLKQASEHEAISTVQKNILTAYGKCSSIPIDIEVLYDELSNSNCCKDAAVWGIYYAGLKGVFTERESILLDYLNNDNDLNLQVAVASYFARFAARVNLDFKSGLLRSANEASNIYLKNNLIKALSQINDGEVISFYGKLLNDAEADYRWKVSALKAASKEAYKNVGDLFWGALNNENKAVVIIAAAYLKTHVPKSDIRKLIDAAKATENIRAKTDLLVRCKELVSYKEVDDYILEVNYQIDNVYDAAQMVKVEDTDRYSLDFIETLIKKDSAAIISTTVFEYFLKQFNNQAFLKALQADAEKEKKVVDQYIAYMLLGDPAIIYMGANALNNENLPLKSLVSDYTFLSECLDKLSLPRDVEIWLAIQNAIKSVSDTTYNIPPMPKGTQPINWETLKDIKQGDSLYITSNKGTITIELFAEDAPGTVALFSQLVEQGFYNGKTIHRHVPDFVVQGGCPRGDGFGGLNETIRSEFSMREYDQEGLLGIASAGKDTESCQFFITHSPTPHLNGKYTIFAQVIDGMDVVHQLEVGDSIENISK